MPHIGSVFFFQAEDGIRDVAVTGVQTCALPISARHAPSAPAGTRLGAGAVARCAGRTARPAEKRTLAGQGRGPWLHGNPLRRGGAAARSRKKGGGWAEARAGPAVWR